MKRLLVLAALATSLPLRADYLFTYFTKNGEDGLHLAASADGYHWERTNAGASYLKPTVGISKLMRDPCVTRGPDGTYHMVWTAGWTEDGIGYASTRDFITWSPQKYLRVMAHEPTVKNTWAPEIVWDARERHFLIFWASTVPGRFPETANASENGYNHRMYSTSTRDFETFTPTRLFYDPGFSVIDATFLREQLATSASGGAGTPLPGGERLHLILKDETRHPPKKHLQIATAASYTGPFGKPSVPFTPEGWWVEGPTAARVGDHYIVYFDAYTKKHYGAMRSRDLKTWEDATSLMTFPDEGTPVRMRHGTVIEVPAEFIARLREASQRRGGASARHSGP